MASEQALAQVGQALEVLQSEMGAPECHGTLCGLLCARGEVALEEWLTAFAQEMSSGDVLAGEARGVLEALYRETLRQLGDSTLQFHLLLPDDSTQLLQRLQALGEWCQGFVLGMSLGGVQRLEALPADSAEMLTDLTGIADVASYELDDAEEDEAAYTELMEYVRTAVLLINEELNPSKAPPRTDQTLH